MLPRNLVHVALAALDPRVLISPDGKLVQVSLDAIAHLLADPPAMLLAARHSAPLAGRAGLRTEVDHPLSRELGNLLKRHKLIGGVLLTFTGEPEFRVGANGSGEGLFGDAMEDLADKVLAAIDDGLFDPKPQ